MIFVTVGTHEQPFNRLVKKIDELKGNGTIQDDVFIQTGFSTYEPKNCQWSKLIPYQQMVKNVEDAHIVITHGGPASFIMPLQIGKTPIVVPRQHQFNEHVNDHQVDLFEGQYVVENGMAYNSYVITDDKIAVMDTVDQNFTDELPFELQDGSQPLASVPESDITHCIEAIYGFSSSGNSGAPRSWQRVYGGCFLASWKKEYFTSALPNTQRGPIVNIPLGDTAPVMYGDNTSTASMTNYSYLTTEKSATTGNVVGSATNTAGKKMGVYSNTSNTSFANPVYADLSEATNTNIIELRRAFRIQEFLERMNAGGSRLTEMIYSMFGVKSPDARLQRAEFIGASHNPVLVDAVYQTSASQEGSPLADFAGKALSVGGQKPISYY